MLRDTIIEQNNLGLKGSEWDLYDRVIFNFALWIDTQKLLDRFYVVTFEMRYELDTNYEQCCELFELDEDYHVIFQIDWCEGQTILKNIKFYSLDDIHKILRSENNEDK